jgi:L-rhamnose-H+ transport protein
MSLIGGLVLVLLAGILQGSFILPTTLTRHWKWEHNWAMFSLLGMLGFNWLIAGLVLPDLGAAYRNTPMGDLKALLLFGALWGAGAILFGMGMERLGMALGYPIIMGLILSLGALIPLLILNPRGIVSQTGLLLLIGTAVTIVGIAACAQAAGMKQASPEAKEKPGASGQVAGLIIAVFAGALSCLPNVGMNYAGNLKAAAIKLGAAESMAGNAAWALFFTAGFVVNAGYCLVLMIKGRNFGVLRLEPGRNLALMGCMGLMWIGSFYLYGMGAARMGRWGGILGWPLFISLAILVGNLWGLRRGEWTGAPPTARRRLTAGLLLLLGAVICFGLSSAAKS